MFTAKMRRRYRIRRRIIRWLAGAYDSECRYLGNPDYFNRDDVERLVDELMELWP